MPNFWTIEKISVKRKEISREDIRSITEIYSEFKPGKYCKIFNNKDFMYKEYAVYQPLQRTGSLSAANIASLKTSTLFTANGNLFNEAEYEELLETNPRGPEDEKKFRKYQKGKEFIEAVISVLEQNISDKEYKDYSEFEGMLKKLIGNMKE